jgi:hypothetical protein
MIYNQAVDLWGEHSQMILMMEESAELINEIAKFLRGRSSVEAVCSEIADVKIMCKQMQTIFGEEEVKKQEERKLKNLEGLIEKYKRKYDIG